MREHLYKARRKDNGEWVEGYIYHDQVFKNGHFGIDIMLIRDDLDQDFEVIESTICQFIGRTDINEKKVFEGDQCYVWESRGADGNLRRKWERPLTITYDEYLAKFGFDDRVFKEHWNISKFEVFEVVGNVHDKEAVK